MLIGEDARQISRLWDVMYNGSRAHYMRAIVSGDDVKAQKRQDSALLTVLASANALIVRQPEDPPRSVGETVDVLLL